MHYHHFYRQGYFLKYGEMPTRIQVRDYFEDPNTKAKELMEYADTWYHNNPNCKNVSWDVLAAKIANDTNLKFFV